MSDDVSSQGQPQKELSNPPVILPDGTQRFTVDQFKSYVGGIVKKEYVRAKHGLEDWEIDALNASRTQETLQLSQESDPKKLREVLPEGTLVQTFFDSLLELLPDPESKTDWMAVADLMDGGESTKSMKQSREQIKDAVYRINIKLREHHIAPFFKWGRKEISRCR